MAWTSLDDWCATPVEASRSIRMMPVQPNATFKRYDAELQ